MAPKKILAEGINIHLRTAETIRNILHFKIRDVCLQIRPNLTFVMYFKQAFQHADVT